MPIQVGDGTRGENFAPKGKFFPRVFSFPLGIYRKINSLFPLEPLWGFWNPFEASEKWQEQFWLRMTVVEGFGLGKVPKSSRKRDFWQGTSPLSVLFPCSWSSWSGGGVLETKNPLWDGGVREFLHSKASPPSQTPTSSKNISNEGGWGWWRLSHQLFFRKNCRGKEENASQRLFFN